MATKIKDILNYLLEEADAAEAEDPSDNHDHDHDHHYHHHHHFRHIKDQLDDLEPSSHVRLLQQLLCVRQPDPELPADILDGIDAILNHQTSRRVLTQAGSIQPTATLKRDNNKDVNLSLWQGDITTLTGLTAITNAANSQGLGCFQPPHRCIDNIIHSWAGPRLRHECNKVMQSRGREIEPGEAIVTRAYCLAADHVVHTVGPQLRRGAGGPTALQREQLAQCYASVLSAVEDLPATSPDGRKIVALCGISTGLFAFPVREAAAVAVRAVTEWLEEHEGTSVTDVIFDTFIDEDTAIYEEVLARVRERAGWLSAKPNADYPPRPVIQCGSLERARAWLESTDAVLISAGAGLSASDGLDYTSPSLFAKHFPGFLKYGLRTLYSVFGYEWPSEKVKWGYFFTHLAMVRAWPASVMYRTLISWLERFGSGNAHVRTSNADGLFLANGLDPQRLSTPQGAYAVLQCLANCRPEATVRSAPLVEAAQSYLDPASQVLTNADKIPSCQFCGGKMNICVRAGDWFNEVPFQDGERRWRQFRSDTLLSGKKTTVILELGAGMSTPGVLRWPNEDSVARGRGKVKLIRVGLGPETAVPWDLDEAGLAISIDGDISAVVRELLDKDIDSALA